MIDYKEFQENSLPYLAAKGDLKGLKAWIETNNPAKDALTQLYEHPYTAYTPIQIAMASDNIDNVLKLTLGRSLTKR